MHVPIDVVAHILLSLGWLLKRELFFCDFGNVCACYLPCLGAKVFLCLLLRHLGKKFWSCFQLDCFFLFYFLIQSRNFSSAEGIVQTSTPRSFQHPMSLFNPTSLINLTSAHYHLVRFPDPVTDGSGSGNLTNIHLEIDGDTLKQGDFNCGASSHADFFLNYFLSKVLKFTQISSQILRFLTARLAGWAIKVTLL